MSTARDALFTPEEMESLRVPRSEIVLPGERLAQTRMLSVLGVAYEREVDNGKSWYGSVHATCEDWVATIAPNITVRHAAGVIAALSPMQSWDRNMIEAHSMLVTGDCKALGYAKRDAQQMANGVDPLEVLFDPSRNNLKVRSFFGNIADPEDPLPVTIDRHMIALITDNPKILKIQNWITPYVYEWCAEQFRTAAAEVDLLPNVLQAIDWVVWRRLHSNTALKGYIDEPLF